MSMHMVFCMRSQSNTQGVYWKHRLKYRNILVPLLHVRNKSLAFSIMFHHNLSGIDILIWESAGVLLREKF